MKTLVLYANYTDTSSYFNDWLDALKGNSSLEVTAYDIINDNISWKNTIKEYDLIVLLHSTNADNLSKLKKFVPLLNQRRGKLVIFPGNEVNLLSVSMNERIEVINSMNTDFICTQLLKETGEWLYKKCEKSTVLSVPHALNEKSFFPKTDNNDRSIDFGARSFKYSYLLGDNQRNNLFQFFIQNSNKYDLNTDISTDFSKRFTRTEWCDFLNNCKGTISNEAGTFYLERDDRTIWEIQNYLKENYSKNNGIVVKENSLLEKLYKKLHPSVKTLIKKIYFKGNTPINHEYFLWEKVSFNEIYDKFFKNYEKPQIYSKAISSRHFDAIGTKTCQLMVEGRYNDILKANEHYIPVKTDFSDIDEAIEKFKDWNIRKEIIDRSYDYVLSNHTHQKRIDSMLKVIFN